MDTQVAADNHYLINDAGKYEFFLGGDSLFETDEVAFLYDTQGSNLLKHGTPSTVAEIHHIMSNAFLGAGHEDTLVVIHGKFPLEEINGIVGACDRLSKFYQNHLPEIRAERAQQAFEDYDFGPGVNIEDSDGWQRTAPDDGDWTRVAYAEFGDGTSDRISFHVRFAPGQSTPSEVYGLLMSSGGEIGNYPGRVAKAPAEHPAAP